MEIIEEVTETGWKPGCYPEKPSVHQLDKDYKAEKIY